MKQNIFKAVVVAIVTLCTLGFVACKDDYSNGPEKSAPVPAHKEIRKLSCGVNRVDTLISGVVQTRGAYSNPEGTLTLISYQKASWLYGKDTVKYAYTGEFIAKFFDVKFTRYAHNFDIFKNPRINPTDTIKSGVVWTVSFKDSETHDFDIPILLENAKYEKTHYQVGDSLMDLCRNDWVNPEMIDAKLRDATSPDDKYYAKYVDLYFQFGLEEGPDNKKTCKVTLLVLVPKGGPDVPIPDDKHEVISFEDVDKGYDLINDSINDRWIDLVKVLSNGTREPFPRVAFISKNHLFAPAYQTKEVTDFNWQSQLMKTFEATPKETGWVKKENNIYVLPMIQNCATYTDKGTCVFLGDFDGQAYFVDSLGQKHYFLYKEYEFVDDGWQRSDMQPTENFERKLLSSDIRGFFNGATLPRTGEIELRKLKDSDVKLVGYEYKNFGIRPIVPNVQYWTFAEQWAVFSNNKTELVGEIGTKLNIRTVIDPKTQEVDVDNWGIKDASIQKFDSIRQTSRPDTISTGIFKITPYSKKNITRTNMSKHNFTTTYDGTVVFKDKFGNEVKFKALAPTFEDKGGVSTLKDLLEENDYERKGMTSTLAVTAFGSDVSDNVAEVIFRKKVEHEELLSWDVEQTLVPAGDGKWTSTTTIIYNYKLAGQKKSDPIPLTLDWSIVGEAKSQIIMAAATQTYVDINPGGWGTATESHPQTGVTVYTRKNTNISENYTTLTDKYTATMETAKYSAVVEGKTIAFDFLAPSGMTVAHKSGSLVDGKRTTQKSGSTYDVWDHTGSVTATVTSSVGNQTQDATDEKEILIKKDVRPHTDYDVDNLEGYFLISKVKNPIGWADAVMFLTETHCFTVINSYNKDGKFMGQTTDMVERSRVIVTGAFAPNSIVYDDQTGHYIPALTVSTNVGDAKGWTCEGIIDGRGVVCDRTNADALDEGIKNFVGGSTSVPTPFITQVTPNPTTWHDKNFVTVTWKTSTTTGAVRVGSN